MSREAMKLALREYLQESILPLVEEVLVKKLGQAMTFAKEELTRPAQRTWVSLTDEEISASSKGHMTRSGFARTIEAKLREKNAPARPTVPDALTPADKESPEYTDGWNDCRQAMLAS